MTLRESSFVEVLHDIVNNVQSILRAELRLAKAELREDISQALRGALMCSAAIIASLLAIIFTLIAIQFALMRVMPDWAAALIIAASLAMCAAIGLMAGNRWLKQVSPVMPKTMQSVTEDVEWAKQQIK